MSQLINEPTVQVPASELIELVAKHDEWVGSMHPDEHDEYLARYAHLRKRAAAKLRKFRRETWDN